MSKKIISLALTLIMCLALVPMTALAASTCEKIENDYSNAAPITVGSKVEVGKKQIGTPPADITYYNVNYKYSFTLTDPSLVTVTLTTENPAFSEQKPNYLGLKLMCADEKTEITPLDRSRSDNIKVHSGENRLSDNMSYKLLPGKYYLWADSRTSNNAYGWVQINSVTATQEDFGGEPNDTTLLAQAKASIGTGVDYKGNISYEGNKEGKDNYNTDRWDYYRFDVPSDGYGFKLTVSRADTTVENNIEVYLCDVKYDTRDFSGKIYLKNTPTGSVEYKNLKKGTVYVAINGSWTTSLETEYTFRLDPLDGSAATKPPATTPPPTTTPPATTTPPVIQPPASKGLTATPTASAVLVNGKNVAFDAYNIGGNNYFKLRDLAYTLNGTAKQFNVSWDGAANAIMLTSGQGYAADGGEMSAKGGGAKTAVPTTSKIIKDGKEATFMAYNIDGSNYFKLRDIGQAFNFGVDWDGAKNTIVIDTSKGYAAEGQTPVTPPVTQPTEPTKPTDPPSGTNSLVGKWSSIYDKPFDEANERIEFKSDGTFYFRYYQDPYEWDVIAGRYVLNTERGGTWEVKGNYEVKGDKIHCTKLLYSWKADFGSESNYTNKSVKDSDWAFYISKEPPNGAEGLRNGYDWLCINISMNWNEETDTSMYYSFQKPIK